MSVSAQQTSLAAFICVGTAIAQLICGIFKALDPLAKIETALAEAKQRGVGHYNKTNGHSVRMAIQRASQVVRACWCNYLQLIAEGKSRPDEDLATLFGGADKLLEEACEASAVDDQHQLQNSSELNARLLTVQTAVIYTRRMVISALSRVAKSMEPACGNVITEVFQQQIFPSEEAGCALTPDAFPEEGPPAVLRQWQKREELHQECDCSPVRGLDDAGLVDEIY